MSNLLSEVVLNGTFEEMKKIFRVEIDRLEAKNRIFNIQNYIDQDQRTLLHLAVISRNVAKVEFLLINYPKAVYKKDINNFTPFLTAVSLKLDNIIVLFLKYYPHLLKQKGWIGNNLNVLQIAIYYRALEFCKFLASHYPILYEEFLNDINQDFIDLLTNKDSSLSKEINKLKLWLSKNAKTPCNINFSKPIIPFSIIYYIKA